MATAGSIVVDLLMKTGSFETDSKRAEQRLKGMQKTIDAWSAKLVAGAAAASAAFVAWSLSMTKSLDSTLKMAEQIGTTTEALTGLRYAAQQFSNVSDQTFDMSLRRMTRRIAEAAEGSGAAKNALQGLGLSATELASIPVEEQFLRVADAIKGASDQGTRLRSTMAIFDTEGMPLVSALAQGRNELIKYTEEAQRFGVVVSTEAAQAAAQLQTNLDQLTARLSGFNTSMANKVLPVLNSYIEYAIEAAEETGGILSSAKDLANDKSLPGWVNVVGRGFAIFIDVAIGLGKALVVVAKAFRAVAADAEVAAKAIPVAQLYDNLFGDGGQLESALKRRNETVASFNDALSDLLGYQGDANMQAWDQAWAKHTFDATFVGPLPPIAVTPGEGNGGGGGGRGNSSKNRLDEGQSYIQQMTERIALLGKETEYEQLLARISIGTMKFKTPELAKQALILAKQLDIGEQQLEAERMLKDLRLQQSVTQIQFMRDLESFGQGDQVRELSADLAKVEDRYRSLVEARRNSAQGLSDSDLALIRESMEKELAIVREYHDKKLALQGDWALGAKDSLINYADEAANVYQSMGDMVGNAFKGMEDALTSFVTASKMDFKSLADSIIQNMIRIAIQQSITGPLAGALGGALGNLFGGAAPAGVTPGLDWTFNAKGNVYDSPSLSKYSGGVYDSPQIFAFAKGAGVFGEAGPEAIMPLKRSSDGSLGVRAEMPRMPVMSPALPEINVNIQGAQGQPEVSARRNQNGGVDLDIMFKQIENRIAGGVASGQGAVGRAIERRYALTPQLG